MNKTCLTGRITKDIELRYTTNQKAITNFNLAVGRKYKNANGEYETDFINCVAYGTTAETMNKYIKKGDLLGVEGRIETRTYEDKDNKKVYVTEVKVESIDFLQPKEKSSSEEPKETPKEEAKDNLSDDVFADFGSSIEITDDDLAF